MLRRRTSRAGALLLDGAPRPGAAAPLVSKFPAAGAIVRQVVRLESRYTVVVSNDAGRTLEDVRILGRHHVYAALGPLAEGESATRAFWIAHEGPLQLEAGGVTTTIDGYVTGAQGGLTIVTIGRDGNASVVHGTPD